MNNLTAQREHLTLTVLKRKPIHSTQQPQSAAHKEVVTNG